MADFILQQKIKRMILKSSQRLRSFPKYERYVLAADIRESMYKILRLTIQGNTTKQSKRPFQREMDAELDVLRVYVDIAAAKENRYISIAVYEEWANELNEIGRLLGKWIQTTK